MEEFLATKAVRPVLSVNRDGKNNLEIAFADGRLVRRKSDLSLLMIRCLFHRLPDVKLCSEDESEIFHPAPLGIHEIFGFKSGDFARVGCDRATRFIRFS